MSHQGGFPNWRFVNPDRRLDFKFTPGAMFKYSGEGYRLLQFILEEMMSPEIGLVDVRREIVPVDAWDFMGASLTVTDADGMTKTFDASSLGGVPGTSDAGSRRPHPLLDAPRYGG